MVVSVESFIARAQAKHAGKYTYDAKSYSGMTKKVRIHCPDHGWFEQQAYAHASAGQGCPECKKDRISIAKRRPFTAWEKKARQLHKNQFKYDASTYVNADTKMRIHCAEHGEFFQTPEKHLASEVPCPICRKEHTYENTRLGPQEVIRKARRIHGDTYNYVESSIKRTKDEMAIICPEHGEFYQVAGKHIYSGHGCPDCSGHIRESHAETLLYKHVRQICDADVIRSDRQVLGGRELDIYIPSAGLAIEYCGLYWHAEELGKDKWYHYSKWKECKDQEIRLLTIFEDEPMDKVKNAILSALGKRPKGIPARKQKVSVVPTKESTEFLNRYHLQGSCHKRISYGLYDDAGTLTAVMAFGAPSRQSVHPWELRRFCTDGRNHAGAASRLWRAFLTEHQPTSVISLSDRRWFTGAMYPILGFEWDGEVRPDYYYTKGQARFHKSGFRKSGIQRRLPDVYDERLTEREMMQMAGYLRIWDCGKDRWVWKNH